MKVDCPYLSQFPHVRHAFFEAAPESLSSQSEQAMKAMVGRDLPLITLNQVHGTKVLHVTEPKLEEKEGDGLVTMLKDIAIGILTADCGPVLFYDPSSHMIGACHAGWRGAKDGIIQATLKVMEDLGAKRSQIYATLGPTIQQQDYEVGPEFPDLIEGVYDTYFYPSEKVGHHYFNLPRYIQEVLLKEGLAHVHDLKLNTFSGHFASRRRLLKHGKEKVDIHNLSAIAVV
ncbi:MAG: peptidoglycan editing factor PgeF [Proteobacteria bacterium]|nr:peptidoglycan editing factor PgeF [Pseudomonadota bacterium]